MAEIIEVRVPDIGDFDEVDVVEVLVEPGDTIEAEESLITLESDKASMEVPSPRAGTVKELKVAPGDKIGQDGLILLLEAEAEAPEEEVAEKPAAEAESVEGSAPEKPVEKAEEKGDEPPADLEVEVLVLGSGPGGYSAAFRAADLGKKVALVERYSSLGGVCLNVGCIPSKALLHAAKVIDEARSFAEHGISFGEPEIDLGKLRKWKDDVVGRLTGGLVTLSEQRKVELVHGTGRFVSPHRLEVENGEGKKVIGFEHAIIAAGSRPIMLPDFPTDDPRLMDSTAALELEEIPKRLLVVGGGIIGLEMATVYEALGSKVTVVELLDGLMPGTDRDLVKPLQKRIEKRYEAIYLETKVTAIKAQKKGLKVHFEGPDAPDSDVFDRVLVSIGRRPNGAEIGASAAGIEVDEKGYIPTDHQLRTNIEHIFAIGDITKQPLLAHKASHEGKVAAEVIAGLKHAFDARVIPSVAYTDPEVAWVGVTEDEAKEQGRKIGKGQFPWAASGRSLAMGRDEGKTKLLFDEDTGRVIGGGIVGPNAGDLISEVALAIEMGCEAADIGLTIHPHPTLSETVAFSAEAFEGTLTDLYIPKRKKK